MNEYGSKIELSYYLDVIWKRKWLVIGAVLLFTVIAVLIILILPPKWKVDGMIVVGKFVVIDEKGQLKDRLLFTPVELAERINRGAYNNATADELNININEFPIINAKAVKNTRLVEISLKEENVEKAKSVLSSLIKRSKAYLDRIADREVEGIDIQINSKNLEKLRLDGEIDAFMNELNLIKQRKQEIEKEQIDIRKRIKEMEKEQRMLSSKKNKSESESLALLLLPGQIQQSLMSLTLLNESLSNKNIEEELINFKKADKEKIINQLDNEINDLNDRKKKVKYTQIIKEPTSSPLPVFTKRLQIILTATFLGFVISILLTFFFEYLEKSKARSRK